MKASFLTIFAIGSFIASTIANPIAALSHQSQTSKGLQERQTSSDVDYDAMNASLTTLLADIQKQTGLINTTLTTLPSNPTEADVDAEVAQIAPQLQAITDLLNAANASSSSSTTTVFSLARAVFVAEKRHKGKEDLFKTLSIIIYELLGTVKFIIFKLGLGKVLIYLTPLVLSLKGLLFSLDLVVGGVLLAVGALANELLKTVGLGLIGIVP
ncbi:hypothetical protein F5Y17DRAFT_476013 [Xylariaceae sp. FL0594]|nr:hypothetical protein F5Y17DRAFT_476013 [Xylariaceae sp. FL0594]